MKIRWASVVVVSLMLMSVGVSSVAQAASAGGTCKTVGRTVVDSGVNLRCTPTESGSKWRKFTPPAVVSQPATTTPVAVTPAVSVESTLLRQPGVISVNSNVVGTVYVAEVSVKVAKVSDIENAGSYLWVSAPITKVGVSEISVNINSIINGNYRVYVANDKGVLSAASLNMVVVSMPRLYDSVAAQSWSRQFGSSDIESNPGVAVDAVGNVYVVGSTHSDFVGDIFTSEVYVQKFDASGNEIASIQFGTSDGSAAATVAVDAVGNVYVAGLTRGAFAGNTSQGNTDVFVAKFNSSLVLQGTVKQFGTSEDDAVYSVVVDAVGNVYVAGWTKGAFAGYTNPGLNDGFVAKFNSSLVLQGTVQFGTSEDDLAYSVAVDAAGNVYVAGWTDGAFAGNTDQGGEDGFVAKFNSSLVLQGTVKQFGTSEDDLAYSVAVDAAGNVYVAGVTGGALAGSENQGDSDAFVVKFNSSLVLQGTVQFGTLEVDAATSVAVDAAGNVYVVGATFGAMTGNTSQGDFDVFVARFNSSLVLQGIVQQFGTSEYDVAYSVAVDAAGNVYVAGDTAGDLFGPNNGSYDTFVLKEVA